MNDAHQGHSRKTTDMPLDPAGTAALDAAHTFRPLAIRAVLAAVSIGKPRPSGPAQAGNAGATPARSRPAPLLHED